MPSVRKNESRSDYVKRAIPYLMKKEGLSQHVAVGKAEGIYNQHKKKRGKK